MNALTSRQQKNLRNLDVLAVYIFGSTAEGFSQSHSDFDIGVLVDKSINGLNKNKLYNHLYEIFTELFPGKNLDIVFLNTAGLELRFDVVSNGKLIFESQTQDRLNFEAQTVLQHADFKPLLRQFDQAVLNRI